MASLAAEDKNAAGLVFLDDYNLMVKEALTAHFDEESGHEPLDIRCSDFDDTQFHILVSADKPEEVLVSILIPCYADLYACGAENILADKFEGMFAAAPQEGYDLTLKVSKASMKGSVEETILNVSRLKTIIASSPFQTAFEALGAGTCGSLPPMAFQPRSTENVYLLPSEDRVAVVFVLDFPDPTDTAIARVFLQEFSEAQRNVRRAPPVTFSREPIPQLERLGVMREDAKNNALGYLTFTILPSHVGSDRVEKTVQMLATFRNYLHYHIKASKSHLHTRMRTRVTSLLGALNDARMPNNMIKEKKTMGGKTFNRS
jgi:actin related protein 2/3 complex, subunit 2